MIPEPVVIICLVVTRCDNLLDPPLGPHRPEQKFFAEFVWGNTNTPPISGNSNYNLSYSAGHMHFAQTNR